ncbi:MAG: hypothetical protein ACP5IO_05615 [Elusimicrobiales bacterium]
MKRLSLIIALFFSLRLVYADSTSGFAFLKLPFGSSRMQGLGGNGIALLEGTDAMRINPAGIGFSQMREIEFSVINWIEDFDGKYISYVKPYGTSVLGIDVGYFSTDGFEIRDSSGVNINADDVKFKNMCASFSVAKSFFMERFSIGAAARYVYEDRYLKKDSGVAYDVGAVLKLGRRIRLGVSRQNISSDNKKIVEIRRWGGSISLGDHLVLSLDSISFSDSDKKIGFGAEFVIPEEMLQYGRFVLRTGYNKSPNYGKNYDDSFLKKLGLDDISGWSFGVGVYSSQILGKAYGIEYSFTPYGELGKTSQLTLRMQF